MLERLDALERQLGTGLAAEHYASCNPDNDVCEKECPGGAMAVASIK
jgi:hypothetical protein